MCFDSVSKFVYLNRVDDLHRLNHIRKIVKIERKKPITSMSMINSNTQIFVENLECISILMVTTGLKRVHR